MWQYIFHFKTIVVIIKLNKYIITWVELISVQMVLSCALDTETVDVYITIMTFFVAAKHILLASVHSHFNNNGIHTMRHFFASKVLACWPSLKYPYQTFA